MTRDDLSGDREFLQVALIIFSAVSLGTLEFIKHGFYRIDGVQVPKSAVVYVIILVQVVPAVVLLLADRVIAARPGWRRALPVFRGAIFAVALILIVRQLELYWDPGNDLARTVKSASPALLFLVGLAIVSGIVWLCARLFRGVVLFFYYMSPVAIAMTAILPFQVPTRSLPEAYAQEVLAAKRDPSMPPVFILVFDEMAYDVLVKEDVLDSESFPNLAALAQEGAWFTNATSNYFWSWDSIPTVINPLITLVDQFDLRLYIQYPPLEDRYVSRCGEAYTCRGERYLAESNQLWLAADLALRSLYQATANPLETVMKAPVSWLAGRMDSPYPPVNPWGFQTFTKKQFDLFLNEIEGPEARGTIYMLHSLASHWPYAFDENGKAVTSTSGAVLWVNRENSRKAAMYADSLLGRLVDRLKEEEIYEEAVIVVTSDHGLRLYHPSPEMPPEQLQVHVPLLIRAPGLNGYTSDVDYQHIDFAATLMDVLRLPPPEDGQGVSAFSQERPRRDKVFHMNDLTFVYSREDDSWHPEPTESSAEVETAP